MAFLWRYLDRSNPGQYRYKSEDSITTVMSTGYFNRAAGKFKIGDRISVTRVTDLGLPSETFQESYELVVRGEPGGVVDVGYTPHANFHLNVGQQYNVRSYGARANASAAVNNVAFQTAYSKCTNVSDSVVIPSSSEDVPTFPGYYLSVNPLLSIGCSDSNGVHGVSTFQYGRIVPYVRLDIPRSHHWEGIGNRWSINSGAVDGPEIRIPTAGFANPSGGIVRLGTDITATLTSCQGITFKNVVVNGNTVAGSLGVFSNSAQEGLNFCDVLCRAVDGGVRFDEPGTGNNNIHDINVYLNSGFTLPGFRVHGGIGPTKIWSVSVVNAGANSTFIANNPLFSLRGQHITLSECHGEGGDIALEIGGDGGYWCHHIEVDNFSAFNAPHAPYNQNGMSAIVWFRNTETHNFGNKVSRIGQNLRNTVNMPNPLMIKDDRNQVYIPIDTNNKLFLGEYGYEGNFNADSSTYPANPLPVYTSYYRGVREIALAAGNNVAFDTGRADLIRFDTSAGAATLCGTAGGFLGRSFFGIVIGPNNLTISNEDVADAAENRNTTNTGGALVLTPGQHFHAEYGIGPLVGGSRARWYVMAA